MKTRLVLGFCASLMGCGEAVEDTAPPPTWYADAKPLFDAYCTQCHSTDGIAPFTLDNYDEAKAFRASIKTAVRERRMPPWLGDPTCNDYVGDLSLTDAQIQTLSDWADAGAPKGEATNEPPALPSPHDEVGLSRVDKTLTMTTPYSPKHKPDDYRCFPLDWNEDEELYVTGFRATPGNNQLVHHVIAFRMDPESVEAITEKDAAEGDLTDGYTCFGGPGGVKGSSVSSWLGSWAPGGNGNDFPDGTGIRVRPGSKIVLQIHYNTLSAPSDATDRTSLEFRVEKTVEKRGAINLWSDPKWPLGLGMKIEADEPDTMYSFEADPTAWYTNGNPFRLNAIALHMHTLGSKGKVLLKRSDGTEECLLDIPRWDFHWQRSYQLRDPPRVNPGDQLYLECHWDNTQANQPIVDGVRRTPQLVTWGEGTTDEMCLAVAFGSEL